MKSTPSVERFATGCIKCHPVDVLEPLPDPIFFEFWWSSSSITTKIGGVMWIPYPRYQHARCICRNLCRNPKLHDHSGSCSWGTFRRLAHPCLAFQTFTADSWRILVACPWLEPRSYSCARPRTLSHFPSVPAFLLFALSPSLIISFSLSNCSVVLNS